MILKISKKLAKSVEFNIRKKTQLSKMFTSFFSKKEKTKQNKTKTKKKKQKHKSLGKNL
jgi:hypothetical protein